MVNLEGAGAGGRELIIQTGPSHSWVAQVRFRTAAHGMHMRYRALAFLQLPDVMTILLHVLLSLVSLRRTRGTRPGHMDTRWLKTCFSPE